MITDKNKYQYYVINASSAMSMIRMTEFNNENYIYLLMPNNRKIIFKSKSCCNIATAFFYLNIVPASLCHSMNPSRP